MTRDQSPVAVKVGTESLIEKFVRFQEPRFHERVRPLMNELLAHYNHLKQTDPNYVATVLASRQLRDLLETRRNAFWWRVGRYDVTFEVSSPSKTLLTPFRRYFELTAMDVENQQRNIDLIDTDVRNRIQYDVPGFQAAPVEWNWTQAALRKS